jgi:hypothetical protein
MHALSCFLSFGFLSLLLTACSCCAATSMNAFLSKPLRADAMGVMRAHAAAHAQLREEDEAAARARAALEEEDATQAVTAVTIA